MEKGIWCGSETGIDRLGINIDEAVIYVPINEGTPATFASGASNFNEAWKSYYNAIKSVDPDARIADPMIGTFQL